MRAEPTILHLDLDAFYAAVEQRDKPSLRGRPVVVGGTGGRGVVATASYEARAFGVHSAMSTAEARRRCPNAAFLGGRFDAYREASRQVMRVLRETSPVIEPLSLDEAYVDLEAADLPDHSVASVSALARDLRARVAEATGGLTASVGIGTSKLVAKIGSDLDKPDGLVVVAPGLEQDLLRPMQVTVIPGVGPATAERLRRAGVHTVLDLEQLGEDELVRLLGRAHGGSLFAMARAQDPRPVEHARGAKSISVEDTYETDHVDAGLLSALLDRQSAKVTERLRKARLSGRTVSIKVRLHDFSTVSRSATLPEPSDDGRLIARVARRLLGELDTSAGVRLLGVGVSGLADWIQEDLFADEVQAEPEVDEAMAAAVFAAASRGQGWSPGLDVEHDVHGRGWVWGAGRGVVTVRFETAETPPGRVLSLAADDPALHRFSLVPPEDDLDPLSPDAPGT
ncbi:DNA polymerase IV [Nocardioides scoriae]|uniref:DNA polymerase IV n=1 Tax=Nocardioides scoriae TaxID=642780 RepID=UPI000B808ADC|nr:DNA polymerase IV [Nocardioides scoriae]